MVELPCSESIGSYLTRFKQPLIRAFTRLHASEPTDMISLGPLTWHILHVIKPHRRKVRNNGSTPPLRDTMTNQVRDYVGPPLTTQFKV
jgi:hypothetical protein